MKRAALSVLFGAATTYFAVALVSPPAFLFPVLAAGSLIRRGRLAAAHATTAQRILYGVLAAALAYSWFLRLYPVMSFEAMRMASLGLGYPTAALGGLFLLMESDRPEGTTTIPAAAGLFVISGFAPTPSMLPYLAAGGGAVFLWLASGTVRLQARPMWLAAAAASLAATIAASIVVALPWTQGQVEASMSGLLSMDEDPQSRAQARIGELQSLKLSNQVVLRVWTGTPQKLRTRVLVRFDGTAWHRDPAALRDVAPSPAAAGEAALALPDVPGAAFEVEAGAPAAPARTRVWSVGGTELAMPGGVVMVRAPAAALRLDRAGVIMAPPRTSIRIYGATHDANGRLAQKAPPAPAELAASLALPRNLDPRITELARALAAGSPSPLDTANRIVTHLQANYRYSLDIGAVDRRNPIADFLFSKKQGWCEYFASAAAVLLRAQGIPARYVQGFNVPGSQRKGDYHLVREHDRHAWVEAFIEGSGWIDFDPTPADEYASLRAGLSGGAFDDAMEWVRLNAARLYIWLRLTEWAALARIAILIAAAGLAGAAVAMVIRRRPSWRRRPGIAAVKRTPSELERLLGMLDARLAALGCARPENRAPLEHWSALPARVPADLRDVGLRIVGLYYRERFGGEALPASEIAAAARDCAAPGIAGGQ